MAQSACAAWHASQEVCAKAVELLKNISLCMARVPSAPRPKCTQTQVLPVPSDQASLVYYYYYYILLLYSNIYYYILLKSIYIN